MWGCRGWGEAETSVPLVNRRLSHRFVLRPPAPDHPVGTGFEVSVNVIEITHDVRIGPQCRHHEDIARAIANRSTIDDTTIDDNVLKLAVAEGLQCVDQ